MKTISRFGSYLLLIIVITIQGCYTRDSSRVDTKITKSFTPTAITSTRSILKFPTRRPSQTPKNTNTPTSPSKPTPGCDRNQVIQKLRKNVPYLEFSLFYNIFHDVAFLTIWFSDIDLSTSATVDTIPKNGAKAIFDAARVAQILLSSDDCVVTSFSAINTIVVDKDYNAWFTGSVKTDSIPRLTNPTNDDIEKISEIFNMTYLRRQSISLLEPTPAGFCTWAEAHQKITQQISFTRKNVGFYFIKDETGVYVWMQWDDPAEVITPTIMSKVAKEIQCVYTPVNQLFSIIVDDNGIILQMTSLPQEGIHNLDMTKLQIIFKQ